MPEFELVLPCYNEGKSLETILRRAAEAAEAAGFTPKTFQLVLVENGSADNSREVLGQLKETPYGKWFRWVPVDVNQGYGHGVYTGLKVTSAPFIGWSHADQQCDPKDAFRALALVRLAPQEKTLVKGTRVGRNWKDQAVSRTFETLARAILGMSVWEVNAQPKVFPRALLDTLDDPPKSFAFDLYTLFRARRDGYTFETITVQFPPRVHGVSNWAATFAGRYKTILGMVRYMVTLARSEGRA
ncbi:MAG: glycosyltransferase family 2 protein [Myxococcaceae bacterium]